MDATATATSTERLPPPDAIIFDPLSPYVYPPEPIPTGPDEPAAKPRLPNAQATVIKPRNPSSNDTAPAGNSRRVSYPRRTLIFPGESLKLRVERLKTKHQTNTVRTTMRERRDDLLNLYVAKSLYCLLTRMHVVPSLNVRTEQIVLKGCFDN